MRVFSAVLSVLFLLYSVCVSGQKPTIEWQKNYGSLKGDYAKAVLQTTDGGYVLTGSTETGDGDVLGYHGNIDCWVLKVDQYGKVEWQRTLGEAYFDEGSDIKQTPDGGFIICGTSASNQCAFSENHGITDMWVVKLSREGNVEWQKLYGGSLREYGLSIELTGNDGYIVAGFSESNDRDVSNNNGGRDFWIVKLDKQGKLVWERSLGGSADEEAYSISKVISGGYIVTGYTESSDKDVSGFKGVRDVWVVRVTETGSINWQRSLGGTRTDEGWSVKPTDDGGFIVAGSTASNDYDVFGRPTQFSDDAWVIKLADRGTIQWQKCYGGSSNEQAHDIQTTSDGGYIIAAAAESADGDLNCNRGAADGWTFKINSAGSIEWQQNFGGTSHDQLMAVKETTDRGYIVAGVTGSPEIERDHANTTYLGTAGDFWIIKLTNNSFVSPGISVRVQPQYESICTSLPTHFVASINYGSLLNTYYWYKNGEDLGKNDPSVVLECIKNGDVIACEVFSEGYCDLPGGFTSDTFVVSINNKIIHPQITISTNTTTVCSCDSVIVSATMANAGKGSLLQWNLNGKNTGINGNKFFSNSIKDGDTITCVYFDTLACLETGMLTSNPIVFTGALNTSPVVTIAASSNTICEGSNVFFTANAQNAGPKPLYQWQVNGINAGSDADTFTTNSLKAGDQVACIVHPDASAGCIAQIPDTSTIIKIQIVSKLAPAVVISASSNTTCQGSPVTFSARTNNAGDHPKFTWQINGVAVARTTDSLFTTSQLANGDVVKCLVQIDSMLSCVEIEIAVSNDVQVTVVSGVGAAVSVQPSKTETCAGESVTFKATLQNAGSSPRIRWLINELATDSGITQIVKSTLKNGDKIVCEIIPGAGTCSLLPVKSNPMVLIVNPLPEFSVRPVDTTVATGTQVRLSASVTGQVNSFEWSPANKLANPTSLNPVSVPVVENMKYTLKVTGVTGCVAVKSANIKLFSPLFMPGAFTPNSDGHNDVFRIPPGTSVLLNDFSVFDRWGNKIFTTRDNSKGWDGKIRGVEAASGVYVYTVDGKNTDGSFSLKGSFVLIR